jgi:hypothetical protein
MRKPEGGERKSFRRCGRNLGILAVFALALSSAACSNEPIPDVQVTPNYAGIVQRNLGTSETVSILEMADGTTQTIDMKAQRSLYRLPHVAAGDLLLLSTIPGSLGAAALSTCPGETAECWFMAGGGKDGPDGYVLTEHGFRLKKAATFSTNDTGGTYPSYTGGFSVNRDGEVTRY